MSTWDHDPACTEEPGTRGEVSRIAEHRESVFAQKSSGTLVTHVLGLTAETWQLLSVF